MIERLPKCLHTCLHCKNAAVLEEYTARGDRLVFDGCWKRNDIRLPVSREECDKFEESEERISRKFWEKWNWKVYVGKDLVEQVKSDKGPGDDEKDSEQGLAGPEQLTHISGKCEQPIVHIKDLPRRPGRSLKDGAAGGPVPHQRESEANADIGFVRANDLLQEHRGPQPSNADIYGIDRDDLLQEYRGSQQVSTREPQQVSIRKPTRNPVSKPRTIAITKTERHLLLLIVTLEKQGEANINGKLLSKETGWSRGYTSKVLKRLREKNLIKTADQSFQKVHKPTMEGAMAVIRFNGGSSDMETSSQKVREPGPGTHDLDHTKVQPGLLEENSCDKSTEPIRVRPHDVRFKAEILSGPLLPEKDTWKTYAMKGRIDHIFYKYDVTCVFMESQKSKRRWVHIYVPSFFTDDVKLCIYEAHKVAQEILKSLKKDYGFLFSDLVLTHCHIALCGDPFSYYTREDAGLIKDKEGRFCIDSSKGYKEFEAITKLGREDMEKVLDSVILPVVKDEYNPWELLENLKEQQSQTRQDVHILRENLQLFSQDLNKHLKLVDVISHAGSDVGNASSKVGEAAAQLTKVVEKLCEKVELLDKHLQRRSILEEVKAFIGRLLFWKGSK